MYIKQDENGFILEYYTWEDTVNSRAIYYKIRKHPERYIECPNFPEDCPEAWQHFKRYYRYYTFTPVSPEYWEEHYGPGYHITSEQILAQFTYHPELR